MPDAVAPANPPPATAPAPAPGRQRDPWFDNAKMALIVLVVIGHSWTLLPSDVETVGWAYDFLYSWHIPAFVLVTGHLSKSFAWTGPRLLSLLTTVALPYVVFEGVYALYRHELGGVEFERLWANPHWPMWFLAALFFWRLLIPVFRPMPGKVVVAVAISLLAGLFATDTLDNARILGLLPFFVLGLKMHEGHWTLLRSRRARWYGVVVLLVILVLTRFSGEWIETETFYYRTPYGDLAQDDLSSITIRMVLLLVGLCGAFAFFTVVPRSKTWFASLGSATLVVYLFHGFFVLGAEFAGFPAWAERHWATGLVLTTVLAVPLALILAWPPVSSRLNVLVDPVGVLRRRRRTEHRAAQ